MTFIEERYASATRTSHLETTLEPEAIDMLIAAGKVRDGIGTSLMRLRAERDAVSKMPGARLIRHALKSMTSTRERLMRMAAESRQSVPVEVELRAVVDHVIDLFLDPNCPTCSGVGLVGGYGAPQVVCSTCGGSKKRALYWGSRSDLESLADYLLAQIERKVDTAAEKVNRGVRELRAAKAVA